MSHILGPGDNEIVWQGESQASNRANHRKWVLLLIDLGETRITEEDLLKIESEMNKIIKEDLPVERFELPVSEAIEL